MHNRKIAQRCDDSVVRVTPFGTHSIIRRSRGFAPTPIQLHADAEFTTLAVGGEYNVTSCLLLKSKAFISQHIGDVEKLETYEFHRRAARHIVDLTNAKVDLVACDLHPRFATTALAREFGEEFKVDVVQVQHHHAHAASLMAEYSLPEMVGICCDGAGYGSDGNVWGASYSTAVMVAGNSRGLDICRNIRCLALTWQRSIRSGCWAACFVGIRRLPSAC